MNRAFVCLLTGIFSLCCFGQSGEMQKIVKYVVSKSSEAYLYQEANLDSPVLVMHTMEESEDESGDFVGIELRWEQVGHQTSESSVIYSQVLPIVCEFADWYQVVYTCQDEYLDGISTTAFVPKSQYLEAHLGTLLTQDLSKLTQMQVFVRSKGRYKDYCLMWGTSEFLCGSVLYVGKVIDGIAYFSNYRYYYLNEDKTVTLFYDYEVGGKSINFGKGYYSENDNEVDADFYKLTDEDMDSIVSWFDSQYKRAYVQVDGLSNPYMINLEYLKEAQIIYVEEEPEFVGGREAFIKWWYDHFKLPEEAIENGANDRVVVTFVVKNDGSVENIKVVRSVDMAVEKAVVSTLKMMPKWKPGRRNGKPLDVTFTMPINIKTQ